MEKKEILNKLKYVLIFALSTISLEIVAFWSLNFGFLPSYFLFDLAYILINSAILFLMKGRKSKIAFIIQHYLISINKFTGKSHFFCVNGKKLLIFYKKYYIINNISDIQNKKLDDSVQFTLTKGVVK